MVVDLTTTRTMSGLAGTVVVTRVDTPRVVDVPAVDKAAVGLSVATGRRLGNASTINDF